MPNSSHCRGTSGDAAFRSDKQRAASANGRNPALHFLDRVTSDKAPAPIGQVRTTTRGRATDTAMWTNPSKAMECQENSTMRFGIVLALLLNEETQRGVSNADPYSCNPFSAGHRGAR